MPINMHMEMNLSPMTKEIEKLRTYITTLVDTMANNRPNDDQSVITEIKNLMSTDNSDLKQKMRSYKDKMYKLQKQNDGLKPDNAKIIQKMHDLKKDVLELKTQNTESRNEVGRSQLE
jgi:predicted nuclease with TOPRIM domain